MIGCKIITSCSNDLKAKFVKKIGADLVLNYKTMSEKEMIDCVKEFT